MEALTGLIPQVEVTSCQAVKDLLKNDENENQATINILNKNWSQAHELLPTLSISGGLNALYFGNNQLNNGIRNHLIQKLIGDSENDGIVTEKSVNISKFTVINSERYTHINTYDEYPTTNHNNIHLNQSVRTKILSWLHDVTVHSKSKNTLCDKIKYLLKALK